VNFRTDDRYFIANHVSGIKTRILKSRDQRSDQLAEIGQVSLATARNSIRQCALPGINEA